MGMRIKLHSTDHPNNLLKELNKSRLTESMCDVIIVVGSRSFPAHKAVLACAAGYFQNLFLNTGLDAARTYVVDFITPANFEKILNFVYTSELFTDLINVGVIYEVAEKLGMDDLLKACHSTFPDLENSAVTKQPSASNESRPCGALAEPSHSLGESRSSGEQLGLERNCNMHGETATGYKEDPTNEASHNLIHPQTPKAEEQEATGPFTGAMSIMTQAGLSNISMAVQTTVNSCPQYKVQSNGDYNKSNLFASDVSLDISTSSNSCPSNSDHSKDHVFGPMDELQLEDLGEEDLHFEDPSEELGAAEEVIELSDDSEEELSFENDSQENKAMPCQVCKKVLEPNVQLIRQHARDHVDLLTGNCKVCETHFQDRNSRVTHVLSHIGIFLFSCDMCETKFFTQWQLNLHRREGVFDNNIIVHPSDPLIGKVNLFNGDLACAACRKPLAKDFHVVRGHILDHVNVKGQICGICDQQHLNLCSLMWHTLSHLGISVFSCSICASSFVDRHLLEKHVAVHQSMEEALFRCHYCGQAFKLEAAYRYHVSQHKCNSTLDLIRPNFGDRLHQQALQKRKLTENSTLNLMSKHIGVHKGSLPPDFTIEQTFMYIIHSKDAEKNTES
ncbi:hypothetical protein E2320_016265 [Naja naja]|nr:hypothetical protein E2320_016265 [Naja naja]